MYPGQMVIVAMGKIVGYKLQDGSVVDDRALVAMAVEWVSGRWESRLENVVIGIPEQEADELLIVSFHLSQIEG